jgi:integrase
VKALLLAATPHPKLFLQVLIAVTMGMRLSEILHLQKEEIDWAKKEIRLDPQRLKTRQPREVAIPISPDVAPLLREFYNAAPGPYLFPAEFYNFEGRRVDPNQPQDDNRYHWDKVREAAKLDVRFHDLRHTAITNMVKAGFPDTGIRKICGVSEETMRRIYAHVESDLKNRFRNLFCGKFVKSEGKHGKTRKKD